ncbi:MAG: UTP--glucose-1-phosphate uridylyltransferase [Spirochaetota bacterium]
MQERQPPRETVDNEVRRDMESRKIDVDRSLAILDNYNAGAYDSIEKVIAEDIPSIDGETIVDMTGDVSLTLPAGEAKRRIEELLPGVNPEEHGTWTDSQGHFDRSELARLGERLLPLVSYGVLNGGSATSYADTKKNSTLSNELLSLLREDFDAVAGSPRGKAKGITPAFVNPDGSFGPSFLELKMRALLIRVLRYNLRYGAPADATPPGAPFFQMTSVYNDEEIAHAYTTYRHSPFLADLIRETGVVVTEAETGIQPMIAAYTHSDEGRPKRIFTRAYGREGETLPLPGGHGQNFDILREVYAGLHRRGKRFVYLGNVDNLGFTVDPVSVAYLALTGKQAAFDFAFRTPVDVKGGILVRDRHGGLNAADIGPAISPDEVFRREEEGKNILFNCATGLFNLDYLVPNIDYVVENLPMRFSDQDKDAGKYSQAEQVTWEIVGMLDDFLVFGVDKYERFLAAKVLLETLMTSGLKLDDPGYPTDERPDRDLRGTAGKLHDGLKRKLVGEYGMSLEKGRWIPKSVDRLTAEPG